MQKEYLIETRSVTDEKGNLLHLKYYLIEEDGFLVVYASDRKTVYEYTDIAYDDLPENVRNEIRYGKYIRSQADLYGFLENYSS